MMPTESPIKLPPSQQALLRRAIYELENQDFAARLADYAERQVAGKLSCSAIAQGG